MRADSQTNPLEQPALPRGKRRNRRCDVVRPYTDCAGFGRWAPPPEQAIRGEFNIGRGHHRERRVRRKRLRTTARCLDVSNVRFTSQKSTSVSERAAGSLGTRPRRIRVDLDARQAPPFRACHYPLFLPLRPRQLIPAPDRPLPGASADTFPARATAVSARTRAVARHRRAL
jgi:hypothetical protein